MTELEAQWTFLPADKTAQGGDAAPLKDAINALTRAYKGAQRGKNVCMPVSEGLEYLQEFLEGGGPGLIGGAQFLGAAARRIDRTCR